MNVFLFPLYTLLLYIAFRQLRKQAKELTGRITGTSVLLAVITTYMAEKFVLSVGNLLGHGELLAALSVGTWWLRVLLIPFLTITYFEFARRFDIKFAEKKRLTRIVWGLTAVLLVAQIWLNRANLSVDTFSTFEAGGILGYAPEVDGLLPATIAAHTAGLSLGLWIVFKVRWPWVLVAASAVLAEMLLYPQAFAVKHGLEVILIWVLVATEARAQRAGYMLSEKELKDRLRDLE